MTITDELRRRIRDSNGFCKESLRLDLLAIADRIDKAYKAAVDRGFDEGFAAAEHENTMEEHGWIKPVSADGVPIRFGDKIMVPWAEGKVFEVAGFSYTKKLLGGIIIWVDVYSLEKKANVPLCAASACHHYHAPTVEDVLLEACKAYHGLMTESMSDVAHDMPAPSEIISEYAKHLQLREDA